MEVNAQLLSILQLSDSVFPTGGFAHSVGFESYDKYGLMTSSSQMEGFMSRALENTGSYMLPFVNEARAAGSIEEIIRLDKIFEAYMSNHVANRASVKQGRSLLDSSNKIFQHKLLSELEDELYEKRLHGHMPVIFGVVCKCLEISKTITSYMYLFETLRNITASAVRLGKVGALEGQKLQFKVQQELPSIVERYRDLSIEDAHVCYPILDVVQSAHDKLFSKLFYS